MINRLDTQSEGRISIDGTDTRETDVVKLRRSVGFMMQKAALFPHHTVEENISAVPKLLKWERARIHRRTSELMSLVDLPTELLNRYPNQLSGGQQSRVALARALASDPPVVLMDEPFGALDPLTRDRLQDELLALQKRLRKTIILVTHDIEEAAKLGDRLAVFEEQGNLVQFDTPSNVLARPANHFVRQFVGSDTVLKRLALMRVSDVGTSPENGPRQHFDDRPTTVSHVVEGHTLVLDANSKPLGWKSDSYHAMPLLEQITAGDSLQKALTQILMSPVGVAVQVDRQGRFEQCISFAHLQAALRLSSTASDS
jgi:osmoprotectant transport system ATP-binding protein